MFRGWRRPEKGFFEELEEMNELINRVMHSSGEPKVFGFSMQVGPDGVPHVERFGNVMPAGNELSARETEHAREPFTSSMIDEKNNELNITAEMPGIKKEYIELNATETEVIIKADSEGRKYYKSVNTPCPVDPDSARAKYNNGVLEVTLKLKEAPKPKGKTVKIE
ncbi:MAG: Hsp20/alpha crystallin family protein [Euryarchaeota archaeon]|nr:Hsp20/alpha crystallin family protein [Euryarchaeota archaeon]MCG2728322.1 Hsp20/alpha crystallin family protein [Candidatus Methanoperedenaceae archaeon]